MMHGANMKIMSVSVRVMHVRYGWIQFSGKYSHLHRVCSEVKSINTHELWRGKVILIINANEMHYFSTLFGKELYMFRTDLLSIIRRHFFSTLFGKELYMFRTDLLSIIRSLNTVFTATGICHTGYVDCLLAFHPDLASRQST